MKNKKIDEATILMVDSNLQREEILPSEKVFGKFHLLVQHFLKMSTRLYLLTF